MKPRDFEFSPPATPGLAHVGVREVMDHLTEVVEGLAMPPIIMGHSFGGTFAQLLVGNGLGSRASRWMEPG
jgi:hypothetical protein